ncbi:predicted protein [Nematostella vectensis]|uniref:Ubiquitin-like protease family profile domain-containing protein n=1 Tax=Nematostella vectensis TaxID=45351 RepID=A7T682_NEMVE|nr:predicted protein [Nematostella vectensis]|eukprot:XP_001620626.1 hypothetical protein NEMVEDRAFT_v1g222900 [Nematostella vectensis]
MEQVSRVSRVFRHLGTWRRNLPMIPWRGGKQDVPVLRYPNRIFVGGVAFQTTAIELRELFESYGAVRDVKIARDGEGVSRGSNDAEETPSYRKYMEHKLLSEIDYLVIPIHLMELKHWIFVVLCTLAMTLELYDSAGVSEAHKDVFANLKTKFIHKEMESKKNSWSEHVNNRTPRQSNVIDCGVHMCLMIKRLLQAKFTSPPVAMPDKSREMPQDMADDILNHPFLAAPPDNLKIQDLFLKPI